MSELVDLKDMFKSGPKRKKKKTSVKKSSSKSVSKAKKKVVKKSPKKVVKKQVEELDDIVEEVDNQEKKLSLDERVAKIESFDKKLVHIREQLAMGDSWDDVKSVFSLSDEDVLTFKEYVNLKKKEKFYELKSNGGEIDIIEQYDLIIKDLFQKYNENNAKASDRNYYVNSLLSAVRDRTKFLKEIGVVKKDRGSTVDGKNIEGMSTQELKTNIRNFEKEIDGMVSHREEVMEMDISQPEVGRYTDIKTAFDNESYSGLDTNYDDPFFDQKIERWLQKEEVNDQE